MKKTDLKNRTMTLNGEPLGVHNLDVIVTVDDDYEPTLNSYWKPTADELDVLNRGGFVVLQIRGQNHPPVNLEAEYLHEADIDYSREN